MTKLSIVIVMVAAALAAATYFGQQNLKQSPDENFYLSGDKLTVQWENTSSEDLIGRAFVAAVRTEGCCGNFKTFREYSIPLDMFEVKAGDSMEETFDVPVSELAGYDWAEVGIEEYTNDWNVIYSKVVKR